MLRPTSARTWQEWFFEVFAPNGYVRPLRPLPKTEAERREEAERAGHDVAEDITRLDIGTAEPPSRK